VALITYFGTSVYNPITNQTQHISLSVNQEIALGLQSAPRMAAQYGGMDPDARVQGVVAQVGQTIVDRSDAGKSEYKFEFGALADPQTLNAFSLPGGPVFITRGLLRLFDTEGELAAVLAHEVGHVVARHSAQQMAKAQLTQGLTGAAAIAAYDPNNPTSANSAVVAAMISQLVNLKFSRDDELEADRLGIRFMYQAGYDPRAMAKTMQILAQASQGKAPPDFFATHPNPERRLEQIQAVIDKQFPAGVPTGLKP
jgi:beta-barrel assembly-enhancing protease